MVRLRVGVRGCFLAVVAAVALNAKAGLIVFTDRDAWNAAVGFQKVFNFNSFVDDTEFRTAPFNFGEFSVEQVGQGNVGNFFDVAPFAGQGSVDGTSHANIFLDPTNSVLWNYSIPIMGFGADFAGLGGGLFNFQISLLGQQNPIVIQGPTSDGFFGVASDTGEDILSRMVLQYNGPASQSVNFLMDNKSLAAVPEPASLVIVAMGFLLLAGYASFPLRRSTR